MSNEVTIVNENNAMLAMIERVCLDQNADISKLEKMLDMQERILNRNAEQSFAADFAAMQSELPRIARNGKIEIKDKQSGRVTQSTPFAKLEDINDAIKPIMQKYGFGVSFSIDQSNALITVTAKLLHRLGHSEKTSISLPLDNSGSKNSVQANGSSVSYGKRYAICALLNISTGDDVDGNLPETEAPEIVKVPIADATLDIAIARIKDRLDPLSRLLDNHTFADSQKSKIKTAFPKVQL